MPEPFNCPFRVGLGYDIHRLVPGRKLYLGGVEIPHSLGLDGHSDADAPLHALCDALLGALALGDIGLHFPPNDPRFDNIRSTILLQQCVQMIQEKGYRVGNADLMIVAQKPKLLPYIAQMRSVIGAILGTDAVSIKATTNEGMDSQGECRSISAQAVVLLYTATEQ